MTKTKTSKNYFKELKKVIPNSLCSLSGVAVAAIIVTDKGIFKGVNYEDPILNLGICAERNAIFSALTNGMSKIYEIHILSNFPHITMCGACRQVAATFMNANGKVFTYELNGNRSVTTIGKLLPEAKFPRKKK